MRVIRDEESSTWTLVPMEATEEQILISVAATIRPGVKLGYNGRSEDGQGFCKVRLHAGGHQEDIKEEFVTRMGVWMGGIDFVLQGSTEDDKAEVGSIRNACYFGHAGGLFYLGEIEVEGKKAIVVTAGYCKLCGATMTGLRSCEWEVCDNCSAKCHHQWERGMVHGRGLDIGVGEYCGLCGHIKPETEKEQKSRLEHHLAAERELGVQIIYKDTGLTPSQVAYLQEVASKRKKAR